MCDLWFSRPFEALPRFTSDLSEPQGLCCSKQESYPFQKAGHTTLCLPSLPNSTDLNGLWDILYIQTTSQTNKSGYRHSGSQGPRWGYCVNSAPPDGTSSNLFIAAPVRFVQGVSEKGKIPAAELKSGT